jgi:hypothetical protein
MPKRARTPYEDRQRDAHHVALTLLFACTALASLIVVVLDVLVWRP